MKDDIKLLARGVSMRYRLGREDVWALREVSLYVRNGEFVGILGPSGCGKSTFLRIVAGLLQPSEGTIEVDGVQVTGPGLDRGLIFQNPSLFPWLSVEKNVEFALRKRDMPRADKLRLAREFIARVGLAGFEQAYPGQLSGGMQQRVALARALVYRPAILLMDEPFGALDAQTRSAMQELLLRVWSESGATVLFVTHDVDEALFLCDRVYVMSARPGSIRAEFTVDLPRPRSWDVTTSEQFIKLKREVMRLIRAEANRAQGGSG